MQHHLLLNDIYNYIGDQIDEIMEMLEQLGYDVPVSLADILKEEINETEDDNSEDVVELQSQSPDIKEQLQLVDNTLLTLIVLLQTGILQSGMENDYVVQQNLIEYQKALRIFERKIRRCLGKK